MIAAAAHHELGLGELDGASADIHVALADGVSNLGQRNAERLEPARIDDDAVLLDETADAGDFGDALRPWRGRSGHTSPGCVRSSARLFCVPRSDVLIDPADAGGVGTERRRDAGGQLLARRRSDIRARASVPNRCPCRPRR